MMKINRFVPLFFLFIILAINVFYTEKVFGAEIFGAINQYPASVRCLNGLPEVSLSWDLNSKAVYYRVQRKNVSSLAWSSVGILDSQIKTNTYKDVRWKSDYGVMTFYYRITGVSADLFLYSNEIAIKVPECRKTTTTPAPTPVVATTSPIVVKPVVATTTTPMSTTTVFTKMPPHMKWGAYAGWSNTAMSDFELLVGKKPDMEMVFVHWGNETDFPFYYGGRIRDKGRTMVLFWEATDYKRDPFNQPEYSQDAVLAGNLDAYFKRFADGAKLYGGPVILIPYSEFNGNWYPWGGTIGNNTPEKYIKSYRYLKNFFRDVPNVKFAWVPNSNSVPNTANNQMELYYPGDDVVDFVGVDGFNFGGYSFKQIFTDPLTRLKKYNKPIYIFSFATTAGLDKAKWIKDAMTIELYKYPEVAGWLWFNQNKERDWRVNSDPQSLSTFQSILP